MDTTMKAGLKGILTVLVLIAILTTVAISSNAAPKKKIQPTPTPTATIKPTNTPVVTQTPTPPPTPTYAPTPTLTATPTPTPTSTTSAKKVLGFTTYYYTGDKSSYNSIVSNVNTLDEIITATHITDGLGNITGTVPVDQLTYANSNNINTILMIGNNFDGSIAKTLLENPNNRKVFIQNLMVILKANGYKGVNIDLEGVYYYDRSYYTQFLSEIQASLNPAGYLLSVSVPAKTYDSLTNSWNGAFDYAAISKYADQIVIMAYDEHYPGGTPGAIASIGWVTNVVKYAVTVIPKEKVYLGAAAYGYDWYSTTTKAYSINGCLSLAASNNAAIQWDDTSKSPWFSYTDSTGASHNVWFENSQSISYKLDLVNTYGLAGMSIWRLGLENTEYWNSIKTKLGK
jgi:Predicted glycosyl hydrolase